MRFSRRGNDRPREARLIEYWRSILLAKAFNKIEEPQDFQLDHPVELAEEPDASGLGKYWATFDLSAFLDGQAPEIWARRIFALLDEKVAQENRQIRERNQRLIETGQRGKVRKEKDPVEENPHFVAEYAPFAIKLDSTNPYVNYEMPCFGVLKVARTGKLAPLFLSDDVLPPPLWIRRKFLAPTEYSGLVIGEDRLYLEAVKQWGEDAGGVGWPTIVELLARSWKGTTGIDLPEWLARRGRMIGHGFIRYGLSAGPFLNLYELYGNLLNDLTSSAAEFSLYRSVVTGGPGRIWTGDVAGRYYGFMGSKYGLTQSQRTCIRALSAPAPQEVLAVNGPPGTGKTTLLQAVVASLMVRAVLRNQKEMPLVIACGATNQSVTNILSAFASAGTHERPNTWEQRWIPGLQSFGMYAKAISRQAKMWPHQMIVLGEFRGNDCNPEPKPTEKGRLRRRPTQGSLLRPFENSNRLVEHPDGGYREAEFDDVIRIARLPGTETAWLERASALFGKPLASIKSGCAGFRAAVKALRSGIDLYNDVVQRCDAGQLVADSIAKEELSVVVRNALEATAVIGCAPAILDRWRAAVAAPAHPSDDQCAIFLAACDITLAQTAFCLAARYWEGRFIENCQSWPSSRERQRAFRLAARLTPCIVSTFDSLRYLHRYDHFRQMALWDEADLLIVDEAGQAGPEKGAIAFAFAKRALVVGDVHQLQPVEGEDTPFFSIEMAKEHGVDDADSRARGLLCGEASADVEIDSLRGSVMRMSSYVSRFNDSSGERAGMWLYDHFRCQESIIRYCNDNWYEGRLTVRTPKRELPAFPQMGHLNVSAPKLTFSRGSPSNPDEARFIVNWLVRHRSEVVDAFGVGGRGRLEDLVAIVTPFRAQARILKKALREGLPGINQEKIVCDTVHALQGAERALVIFSTVYSGEKFSKGAKQTYFFDRECALLNVAVSRAKQSFLVMGDERVFTDAMLETPTWRLGQALSFVSKIPVDLDTESAVQALRDLAARPVGAPVEMVVGSDG